LFAGIAGFTVRTLKLDGVAARLIVQWVLIEV
jgi:hypothetical protein